MALRKETSVGCIIMKDDKFLIVYEDNRFFWGFPKGHMEENESEIETAKREIMEEIGLEVEIDESKRYTMNYIINNEIDKTTVLYLATPITTDIVKQKGEILETKWATADEVLDTLTYDNWKDMFKEVIKDLNNNIKR